MSTYAGDLLANGYVVVPTSTFKNPAIKRDILDEGTRFPDFKSGTTNLLWVVLGLLIPLAGFTTHVS